MSDAPQPHEQAESSRLDEEPAGARSAAWRPSTRAAALLDALVDAAPVGIAFWNADLRYERLNDALARLNGAPAEQHIGRTPEEVMGDMGRSVEACLRRAIGSGQPVVEVEISGTVSGLGDQLQHREGSWFPIFDDAGVVVGAGGVVRDVTERHISDRERSKLLADALRARAHADAARLRSEANERAADEARREAEAARRAAQEARGRTQFLMNASARMAESMDVEDTLSKLARTAVPTLADGCFITTLDTDGSLSTNAVAHRDPELARLAAELVRRYPSRLGGSDVGRVIATGRPELTPEITDEMLEQAAVDEDHLQLLRATGFRSAMVLPLRAAGEAVGALTLVNGRPDHDPPADVIALARALADQASLHIRNAQLYTERSHIARTLQASLLPRALPEIPGVQIAARYAAAGSQNRVGGDFYDVFESDAGTWSALLGDVSGKGAEAAAVTALARHTLRTASLHQPSPAANLATLNRALIGEVSTARFCTVVYARVRPSGDGALVTFANGGHVAPRVLRAKGDVERLEVSGPLVGVIPDARFDEVGVRLEGGEVVLMVTDGVTEVRSSGCEPDLGDRELDRTLAGLAGASAEDVVQAVLERALDMHDGQPPDDMAMVALRVTGR